MVWLSRVRVEGSWVNWCALLVVCGGVIVDLVFACS